jgi:hypothetical protein
MTYTYCHLSEKQLAEMPYPKLYAIADELKLSPASWFHDDLIFLVARVLEKQKARKHLRLVTNN